MNMDVILVKKAEFLEGIRYKLISYKEHESELADCPYIRFLDMAAMCVYVSPSGKRSIKVTNNVLQYFEISKEEIFKQAQENLKKCGLNIFSPQCNNEAGMYVASNKDYMFGANVILSDEYLRSIVDEIGEDRFYLIPSSIHEVIIVPCRFIYGTAFDVTDMKEFIKQTNANPNVVSSDDVLTNSLYLCRITNNEDSFIKEFIRL